MRTTSPRRSGAHPSGDRGAILIIFAISLSALMTLAALVLGASTGYSASRNAQNAADAAATAATTRLHQVRQGSALATEVETTAVDVAEDNGAESGSVACQIVTAGYALSRSTSDIIGDCSAANVLHPDAGGVRVQVDDTREVPFGVFVASDTITATQAAAATVQPVRGGSSPFMLCSSATGHPIPPLIADSTKYPPYAINPLAVGQEYVLWGNEMKNDGRDCGNPSSSWRGLVAFEQSFPLPSPDAVDDTDWWEIETGNKSGQISSLLTGGSTCGNGSSQQVTDLSVGCRIAVPMCTHGNGQSGSNFKLHCVRLVAFEISYIGKVSTGPAPCHLTQTNNIICGTFIGSAVANQGSTGASQAEPQEVVAIRLVE